MLRFNSVHLKNVVFFKDIKFKFKSGITVIRGLNRNSPRVDRNTNGVGKSLLFGALPNVLYATTPLSTRKNEKKSILGKDSSITFALTAEKQKYEIIQRSKGQTVSYNILKNGSNTEVRTATIAEEKIRNEIFPLSEELFYTTVFLSVQRFPTFLRGTSAQRQEFFTEIFNLDHYDRVRAQLNAQVKELKAKSIKLEAVQEQLDDIEKLIAEIDWTEEKASDLKTLTSEVERHNKNFLSYSLMLSDLQNYLVLAQRIKYLKSKLKYKDVSEESLAKQKRMLEKQIKSIQKYDEYTRAAKKYKQDTEKLTSKMRAYEQDAERYREDAELSDIERRIEKLTDKRDSINARATAIERLRTKYASIQRLLPDTEPNRNIEELNRRIGELKQIINLYRILDKGKSTDTGKCPLCSSEIDAKRIRKIAESAIAELPKREKELEAAKGFAELKRIHKEAYEYRGSEQQLSSIEKKLDKLYAIEKRINTYERIRSSIRDVKHALKDIHRPERVEAPDTERTTDELDAELREIIAAESHIRDLTAALLLEKKTYKERKTVKQLEHEIAECELKQRKLSKRINHINETLPALSADEKRLSQLNESHAAYLERATKMKSQLLDLPILEALIKAYSAKGLKLAKLQQISELVENNFNLYSPLIFAEPFQFKINIKENDFSVIVDRGNGQVSDIRRLSGAESSCFNLLLLLSILPLIPNARRVDTVILDEPDAFFGQPIRELFVSKFLPMLQSIVPKIIFITTASARIPDAHNYIVIKEGKESRLEEITEHI